MVIVLLISLYTTRVVLRVLGVEDYGVNNVVCGFVGMFSFLNTSMSNGIQRFFNYSLGKEGTAGANRVFVTAFLIQTLTAIIIVILTESLGLWYLHNKMVIPDSRMFAAEWIFQFSILGFIFVIMQAPFSASVMAHERMDFYAIVSVIDAFLKLGIAFLLPILSGDSLIWFGILGLIINMINFLLYAVYAKMHFIEIKFQRVFDKSLFKSMLSFSGWNLFGSFSVIMQSQGINLVINFFFGPIVNAARGVASQVNAALEGFVNNITIPVRPQVVQSYASGDTNRMMNLTYSISKLSCAVLLMMAIPLSIEINYVFRLWLGDRIPEHAAAFTVIVIFSSLISNLSAPISNVVHATGKMRSYQFWCSIVKVSCVPIAFLALKVSPIPELALLIVFICRTAGHIVGLFIVRTLVDFSLRQYLTKVILQILFVIGCSFAVSLPIHYIMHEGFLRLILVTISSVSALALSLFFVAFNDNERSLTIHLFQGLVNNIRKKKTYGR